MNIKMTITQYIAVFITTICLSTASLAASHNVAFVLVNDDSGVMTDMEKVPELRAILLGQYKALKRQSRHYAKAEFVLISTSLARPVWYGKISDLSTPRGGEIIERTANTPQNCNQLAASFDAARNAIVQLSAQGFTEIHVSIFSSLISTPVPCDTVEINLPQLPVPVDWAATLAPTSNVRSITFYAANTHQYPIYAQSLQSLVIWADEKGKQFSIHDVESSINILRFGLKGADK